MTIDKISILFMLTGLAIFGANIQEIVADTSPGSYKVAGIWYVVATIDYDPKLLQSKCWNVTISMTSPKSFTGISHYTDVINGSRVEQIFNASRDEELMVPITFNALTIDTKNNMVQDLRMILYENYFYNYSIWYWEDKTGKKIHSLVVNRNATLSEDEKESLNRFYPNVKMINNTNSSSCSAHAHNETLSKVATNDRFKLAGIWYVAAYQESIILSPKLRCWILDIQSTSPTLYTGASSYSMGDDRVVAKFEAEQFNNWTYVVKFHVTVTDDKNQNKNLWIVPHNSYIYNYSIWVSYKDKQLFNYLVVSRNPILSKKERNSLGATGDRFQFINNRHSDTCLSRTMEEDQSSPLPEDEDTENTPENPDDLVVGKRTKPSQAHRPCLTISSLLFLFFYLWSY